MTPPLSDAHVLTSAGDGIGRIVLNRPEKRNALTHAMMTTILDALDAFGRDDAIRVVLLTAHGSSFCSGVDLADMYLPFQDRSTKGKSQDGTIGFNGSYRLTANLIGVNVRLSF